MKKKRKKRRRGGKGLIKALCASLAALTALCAGAYLVGRLVEKRTYRLKYPEQIIENAKEFGLDPYLVAAVIHCESSNDRRAVSPVGARGLMQIMPDTGGWIARNLNMPYFGEETLFEPDSNIRMGCWYLKYLMDRYSGNRRTALAAYNAGPGNVGKWLEDGRYSADGMLTAIPFAETGRYIEKVQRAYEKYIRLYKKELG